jgi:hypothetical protein
MAFFFFDDGAPDAEDYVSNYIFFDENNPEWYDRLMDAVKRFVLRSRVSTDTCSCDPAGISG